MPKSKRRQKVKTLKRMPMRWYEILAILPTVDFNYTEAGRRAGYSRVYAEKRLPPMLKKSVEFCRALDLMRAKLVAAHDIDTNKLIAGWQNQEEGCIADFIEQDEDGEFKWKNLAEMPRAKAQLVESIKITRVTRHTKDDESTTMAHTQMKLYSASMAREHLGKIIGYMRPTTTRSVLRSASRC